MAENSIQKLVKAIVDRFSNQSTRDEARNIIRDAQELVQGFYERSLGVPEGVSLTAFASKSPQGMHDLTERHFGFNVYEQPSYSSVDDFAWESSQRYTTLEGVDLPANAQFFDSKRRPVSREDMEQRMAGGKHHLFDIALSNEYVLLGADEKFSVNDLENRFSTNNEHLVPQSKSRQEGGTRVFKSDPRVIVISDIKANGDRGNLQVVFLDPQGHVKDSISLITGDELEEPVLVRRDLDGATGFNKAKRYPIGPEDAPHYAYALGLAYFGSGMSVAEEKSWFDKEQAQQVATMLGKLSEQPIELNKEPVLRDILTDAKVLNGRINPVALLPEAFSEALQTEIDQNRFNSRHQLAAARQAQAKAPNHTDKIASERTAPKRAGGMGV